jgi:hydrogenase maturation factor
VLIPLLVQEGARESSSNRSADLMVFAYLSCMTRISSATEGGVEEAVSELAKSRL